jgi:cell division protein DivIC
MEVKKRRKNPTSYLFIGALIMLCFYVLSTLYEQQREIQHLRQQEAEIRSKIERAQAEADEIKKKIESSGTDQYIESIAREQLKMVGSDEIIFIDLEKSKN